MRVPAGNQHSKCRKFQFFFQACYKEVRVEMIDSDERNAPRKGQSLGKGHTHQQAAQ